MFPKQFNKKKTHLKGCTINASNPKIKETTPFTFTYAISASHHESYEFESHSW
jgi:hypothetical protein